MKTISREEFEKQNVFGTGAENTGFAQQERDGIRKKEKRHAKNDFSFFKYLFWNHRLLIRCKRYGCYRG